MEPKTIKIDQVEYVRADSVRRVQPQGELKICILQRGWVMVGRLQRKGNDCVLRNASVIRIWGTTQGLGELAERGPLPGTKLDPCHGVVEFDRLTMVASIACEEGAWKGL